MLLKFCVNKSSDFLLTKKVLLDTFVIRLLIYKYVIIYDLIVFNLRDILKFQDCFFGFYFEFIKRIYVNFQDCFFGFYFYFIKII
jgi:hypothetical protein